MAWPNNHDGEHSLGTEPVQFSWIGHNDGARLVVVATGVVVLTGVCWWVLENVWHNKGIPNFFYTFKGE